MHLLRLTSDISKDGAEPAYVSTPTLIHGSPGCYHAPEHIPESPGMRWLPIAEVETLIGKKEHNARYWLERHDIPARGVRPKLFSERAILAKLSESSRVHTTSE